MGCAGRGHVGRARWPHPRQRADAPERGLDCAPQLHDLALGARPEHDAEDHLEGELTHVASSTTTRPRRLRQLPRERAPDTSGAQRAHPLAVERRLQEAPLAEMGLAVEQEDRVRAGERAQNPQLWPAGAFFRVESGTRRAPPRDRRTAPSAPRSSRCGSWLGSPKRSWTRSNERRRTGSSRRSSATPRGRRGRAGAPSAQPTPVRGQRRMVSVASVASATRGPCAARKREVIACW